MSDTYSLVTKSTPGAPSQPSYYAPQLQPAVGFSASEMAMRIKLIGERNPYMVDRPDALQAMASQPLDITSLLEMSGQMYGMMTSDTIVQQLQGMSAAGQRAAVAMMGPQQSMALASMGYQPPQEDNGDSFLASIIGATAWAMTPLSKGLQMLGAVPVIGTAFDALAWVGNIPAHLYRTIRLMDDASQWAAVAGAALGIAGVAMAVPTFGASLGFTATAGLLGAGGILAASGAAALTNPGDWMRSWNRSWDGERTFDNVASARAEELLGDPRLVGLAQDIASIDGLDLVTLATEMAGGSDGSESGQLDRIAELAGKMASPGTAEYEQAFTAMHNVLQDPTFQSAVQTLIHGKISPGRDLADAFGIDSGSDIYTAVSGLTDGIFTMAVDPTLVLGTAAKMYKAARFTVGIEEGGLLASNFRKVAERPAIRRMHEFVLDGINGGAAGYQRLRSTAPEFLRSYDDLMKYRRELEATGKLADGMMTRKQLIDWYAGASNSVPFLKGTGAVQMVDSWQLKGLSAPRAAIRKFRAGARSLTEGVSDQSVLRKLAKLTEDEPALLTMLPPEYAHWVDEDGVIRDIGQHAEDFSANAAAYRAGELVGRIPVVGRVAGRVGNIITEMTTMSLTGKAIALNGDNLSRDVHAMMELGRYMGLPSYHRHVIERAILEAESTAARAVAVHGWLANTIRLTGIEATEEGRALLQEYLQRARQAYGATDELVINGHKMHMGIFLNDQADMVVMPNLAELTKAVRTNIVAKGAMGLTDLNVLEAGLNRVWKPLVLMRLAFIPRAAGEELANFMLRGGFGSMTQEAGARYIARQKVWDEVQEKLAAIAEGKAITLSAGERKILDRGIAGLVPGFYRPVVRMMERWGWEGPTMHKLVDFGRWLGRTMEDGLFPGVSQRWHNALENWAGADISKQVRYSEHGLSTNWRHNVSQYADALVFGNQTSIRRMLAGGVSDGIIQSGVEWFKRGELTVMREATSVGHGAVAAPYDERNIRTVLETDASGKTREVVLLQTKGERRFVGMNDPLFENAVHDSMAHWMQDPAMRQVATEVLSRVKGGAKITEKQLDAMIHELWQMGDPFFAPGTINNSAHATDAREILFELAGNFTHDSWMEMVRKYQRTDPAVMGAALGSMPAGIDPTIDSVISHLRRYIDRAPDLRPVDATYLTQVVNLLDEQTITKQLAKMDEATKAFTVQWLEAQTFGGLDSWYHQRLYGTKVPTNNMTIDQSRVAEFANRESGYLNRRERTQVEAAMRDLRKRQKAGDVILTPAQEAALAKIESVAASAAPPLTRQQLRIRQRVNSHDALDDLMDWTDGSVLNVGGDLSKAGEYDSWRNLHPNEKRKLSREQLVSKTRGERADVLQARVAERLPHVAKMNPDEFVDWYVKQARQGLRARREAWLNPVLPDDPLAPYLGQLADIFTETVGSQRLPQRWLYDSLHDAYDEAHAVAMRTLLDPNLTDEGVTRAIRGLNLDETGAKVGEGLAQDATVVMWDAPRFPKNTTFEQLVDAAENKALIVARESEVRALLARHADTDIFLADRQLATELHRIAADQAGAVGPVQPQHIRTTRDVLHRDTPEAMRAFRTEDGPQVWEVPTQRAARLRQATPDDAINPFEEMAHARVEQSFKSLSRGYRPRMRPKFDVVDDAEGGQVAVSRLHRREAGKGLQPVAPETDVLVSDERVLRDKYGKKIEYGDPLYMNPERVDVADSAGEVLWEIYGPMMRDTVAEQLGRTRWREKDIMAEAHRPGRASNMVPDRVPVRRSHVSDVKRVTADDLPSFALAQVYKHRKMSTFDRMVRFGFDKTIGPAIDAIVRKPMAFHAFHLRYQANLRNLHWLVNPQLRRDLENAFQTMRFKTSHVDEIVDMDKAVGYVRALALNDGQRAERWSIGELTGWLRGHSAEDLDRLIERVRFNAADTALGKAGKWAADWLHANRRAVPEMADAWARSVVPNISLEELVDHALAHLPEGAFRSPNWRDWKDSKEAIEASTILSAINEHGLWDEVEAGVTAVQRLRTQAADSAATAAIGDIVPFIDSHEFKTQFSDHYKGFIPFWYAEENFMKRWARGLADEGPAMIRKAQLTYMGMKHAGVIRTDTQGRDYFVYPGSGLLADAIATIIPRDKLPIELMFQTPTESMLPGINNRFGVPSFSPLVTVPLDIVTTWFPELQPVERSMLGDFSSSQGVINQLVPAHLRNLFNSVVGNEDSYTRYASAMTSAWAYMEAHGQGLPDNATAADKEEFLNRLREHARVTVVAQAMLGFIVPGSPSIIEGEDDTSWTGLGITDAADLFAHDYITLVQAMGIEEGTAAYLERNPDHGLADIVNPEAYTVPTNVSPSGAPIPTTESALEFYQANQGYFDQLPNAAPWLFSTGDFSGARSSYAFDQAVSNGLRRRRSISEIIDATMFKQASTEYFAMNQDYLDRIGAAEVQGDIALKQQLTAEREYQLGLYRIAHPLFAEQLGSSDARTRRTNVITEMRVMVNDPGAPTTAHSAALGRAMRAFDNYTAQLRSLNLSRSNAARAAIEDLKIRYRDYMDSLVRENPAIMSFWIGVLRPESSLD